MRDVHPRTLHRRRDLLAAGAAFPLATLGLAACGGGDGPDPDLRAELPRAEPGPVEGAGDLVVAFTAALLGAIDRAAVNAVCSPLSAQVALTMVGKKKFNFYYEGRILQIKGDKRFCAIKYVHVFEGLRALQSDKNEQKGE